MWGDKIHGINSWYYEVYVETIGNNREYTANIAKKAKAVYHSVENIPQRREALVNFYKSLQKSPLQSIYDEQI